MSLIAWYPLNGNINDYSGNGYNLSNKGSSSLTGIGKIGNCLSLTGLFTQCLYYDNFPQYKYKFSWSCWIYGNGANPGALGFIVSQGRDYGIYGINIGANQSNDNILIYIGGTTIISTGVSCLNQWKHITLTADGVNIKVYINGVLNNTVEQPIIDFTYATNGALVIGKMSYSYTSDTVYFAFNGKVNDVRIYDHTLSEKEIREIAKAKILHYTFDDFQEPTTNLFTNQTTPFFAGCYNGSAYGFGSSTNIQQTTDNTKQISSSSSVTKISRILSGQTHADYVYLGLGGGLNETRVFSFWYYGTYGTSIHFYLNNSYNSLSYLDSSGNWVGSGTGIIIPVTINNWQKITIKSVNNGTGTSAFIDWAILHYDVGTATLSNSEYWLFTMVQYETKDHATPFTVGSRSGIINDQSGFRNNATLTEATTPQWVSDSKIGSGAYKFDGIKTVIYPPSNLYPTYKDFSISAWIYLTAEPTDTNVGYVIAQHYGGGGWILSVRGTDELLQFRHHRDTANGFTTAYNLLSTFPLQLNTWYHIGALDNGITAKIYINGALNNSTTYSIIPGPAASIPRIGAFNESGNYVFNGKIDDVRIYSTALSDTDILELYQTRASVDNTGNLFTTEIIQDLSSYSSEYKANNLVINGSAQLGNKTNFSGFNDYINTDGYDDLNCFKSINLYSTTLSDNLIKINKNDTYYLSGYFKSVGSAGLSPLYFGGYCIDKNGNFIEHHMVNHYFSTRTTLAADLVNGATTVQLTSSANWITDNPGSQQWNKLICFWHSGNEYPIYTYTRLSLDFINISGNTVTLLNPWSSGTIPAGTPVANSYHGGTFSYWAAGYYQVPTTWSRATATITGWGVNEEYKFRYGTEYIRIMFLTNYASGDYQTLIDKVEFFNLTSYQSLPINQGVKSNSILYSSKISELGITDGLIAYYPFDKDARDYSGNGRHGIINGNPVLASGIKNLAYNFNGTSDFISIDKSFPDPGIDNFTYSIWFYSPTLRSGEVFGKRATANIEMQISSNGAIYTYLSDTAGITYSSTLYYSASTWYHYCITRSGTQVIIYLNGQNQANITLPANFDISPSTSNLEIARDPGNSGEYFQGNVDEFRVYNRSLSQEEISILYETTAPSTAAMKITKDTVYVKNEFKEVI